jgi:hypothetical protein
MSGIGGKNRQLARSARSENRREIPASRGNWPAARHRASKHAHQAGDGINLCDGECENACGAFFAPAFAALYPSS